MPAPSLYLGQVATRSRIPLAITPTNTQMNSASGHTAMDDITSIQVGFANWYCDVPSTGPEVDGGVIDTMTASIEYPLSTFTQLKFSGASSATNVAAGSLLISDALSISIPRGSLFRVRTWRTAAAGNLLFSADINVTLMRNTAFGDVLQYGTTGQTDKTLAGTITQSGTGANMYYPTLILGQTRKASVICIGDSRVLGRKDTNDTSGDMGILCRALGPLFAYLNCGRSSETLQTFVANNTKRLALMQYFSHCLLELGTNDDVASRTLVQEQADYATALAAIRPLLQSPAKIGFNTSEPRTTDATNTVKDVGEAVRVTRNDWIRTGLATGADFYSEIADVMENSRNGGFWKVTGQQNDGIHENSTGYVVGSAGVNTAAITR